MRRVRLVCVAAVALCSGCAQPSGGVSPDFTAAFVASVDLVGFPTRLDASPSTDAAGLPLSFAWHFASTPPGSHVADPALSSTSGAQVVFEPDLGGDYVVELTVSVPDGRYDRSSQTVTIPTAPIFYYEGIALDGGDGQLGVGVMRSDGTGRRLINCPLVGANALKPLRFAGLYGMRTFEPASGPVRNVFLEIVPDNDGGVSDFRLWSADENSGCTTQPAVRIDSTGFYNDHEHFWPRFSPDGSRVLYVDKPQDPAAYTYRLVTVGVDDKALFVIRSGMPRLSSTPPIWVDGAHIAWVENVSTTATPHLVVYQASDANAAGDSATSPGDRTVLLDCDGPGGTTGTPVLQVINQVELVDGALLVAGATASTGGSNPAPMQIYRMEGACSTAVTLSAEPPGGASFDFAVSPDGKTLVFTSTRGGQDADAGTVTRDLYTVPVDGSSAPAFFAGVPGIDDLGPRWLAGGRQVIWTQVADETPARGGGVMIANADGTHVRSLYAEGNGAKVIAGSNLGTSCDYAGGGAPLATLLVLASVALALGLRAARRASPARPDDRPPPTDRRTG
jgi:hypothetical protein